VEVGSSGDGFAVGLESVFVGFYEGEERDDVVEGFSFLLWMGLVCLGSFGGLASCHDLTNIKYMIIIWCKRVIFIKY